MIFLSVEENFYLNWNFAMEKQLSEKDNKKKLSWPEQNKKKLMKDKVSPEFYHKFLVSDRRWKKEME